MTDEILKRSAKGKRPKYLDDRANDMLLRMLIVTVQELSVTRDRLAALESVLAQAGVISGDAVDRFRPDANWDDDRAAARDDLNNRVLIDLKNAMAEDGE